MVSAVPHRTSVVVPVRNEAESIAMLLDSLRAQTRQPDEVVVCDGGSTDGTPELAEDYKRRGMPVRVLRAGPAFPGRGRNLGIEAAHGDLIALTDAGVRLDARWLERLVAPFEGPSPPDVVYGHFEPVTKSFRQRCIALAFVPPRDQRSGLRTASVVSMAMRRDVWARVGGFREDLRSAEDLLFMRKVAVSRFSVQYVSDAVAFWSSPADFKTAFRRFATYSCCDIRAGLARQWQIRLLGIYLLAAFTTATMVWTPLGALAPVAMLGTRAAKRIVRERGGLAALDLPTALGTMLAIGIIDVATFCGWGRALTDDRSRGAALRPYESG